MLEMVVVLVMMGILLAFVYPTLPGNDNLAGDQRAQTTVSAALDAVTTVVRSMGPDAFTTPQTQALSSLLNAPGCTTPGVPAVSRPPGWPATPRLITDGSPYPVWSANGEPDQATYMSAYATNCPYFANPGTPRPQDCRDSLWIPTHLGAATGDVIIVDGATASAKRQCPTGVAAITASVAAVNTGLAWRVGVAVLAPHTSKVTISTCWMAWREYPLQGADGASARERYFYTTSLVDDAANCTGNAALSRGVPPPGSDAYRTLTTGPDLPPPGDIGWQVFPWSDLACEVPSFANTSNPTPTPTTAPTPAGPGVVVTAGDDTATVVAGSRGNVRVADNDFATLNGTPIARADLIYSLVTSPRGTATWYRDTPNSDPVLVYTAPAGQGGPDSFSYRVTDAASGVHADATVTVTVIAPKQLGVSWRAPCGDYNPVP